MQVLHVSVLLHCLVPDPENPRHAFDEKALQALKESLLQHGQLVELIVIPHPEKQGSYSVIDGHRRRAALLLAGIAEAKCAVLAARPDPIDLLMLRCALGNTGENLSPLENADAAQKIKAARPQMTQGAIARGMGLHPVTLSKWTTISEDGSPSLHAAIQSGDVPFSAGASIARLKDRYADQDSLVERYKAGRLERNSVTDEVNRLLGKGKKPEKKSIRVRFGNLVIEFVGETVEALMTEFAAFVEKVKRCGAKPTDAITILPVLMKR